MLLSVINDVINDYYHPELIKLYKKILIDLDFEVTGQYILFNYKKLNYLKFDNHNMVLVDENRDFAIKDKIIFNPIDDNEFSCSFLALEDGINHKLSILVNDIFEAVIGTKLNIDRGKGNPYHHKDIDNLLITDKYPFYKWKNLYNIIASNLTFKNIISFSFDYSSDYQSAHVKFDYPLYNYLFQIHNNEIFGINFSNSEIEWSKRIYEIFIIDIVEEKFKTPIYVPKNSNKSPKFYIYLKFYMLFRELLAENYGLKFGRYEFFNNVIDNLNDYNYTIKETCNINMFEKIKKLDKKAYKNELKIREESKPNLFLLKDNIVQENQLTVQNNESLEIQVLDDFSDKEKFVENLTNLVNFLTDDKAIEKYKKSLNELISLGENANNIIQNKLQKEHNQKLDRENKLSDINYWQNVALNIINKFGICLWQDFNTQDYSFRTSINNKEKSGNKKEIGKIISKTLNEELNNIINDDFRNKLITIEVKIVDNVEEAYKIIENLNTNNLLIICILSQNIHLVDGEIFDINYKGEFFKTYGHLHWTRNLFVPTMYLRKNKLQKYNRYSIPNYKVKFQKYEETSYFNLDQKTYLFKKTNFVSSYNRNELGFEQPIFLNNKNEKSFIEQFIFYMVNENIDIFNYIMNWLAHFFQKLDKSNTALVLLGDKQLSEVLFFNRIIEQIFGLNYCTTINDEEYKTVSIEEIVKNKFFYHIGNINNDKTKFDIKTLSDLLKQLLVRSSIEVKNKDNKYEIIPIYGQTIITSDNAYEITKSCYSKCTVIKIASLDDILLKMELPDESILEIKIEEGLDEFTDILTLYPIHKDFTKYGLDTEFRDLNKKEETIIVDENTLDSQINEFIQAIKELNIDYFEKVKKSDNDELYKELEESLKNEMIPRESLSYYFNCVYGKEFFKDNNSLLKILKEKEPLFNQCVDKNDYQKNGISDYNHKTSTLNKKQYKIKKYTLKKSYLDSKNNSSN